MDSHYLVKTLLRLLHTCPHCPEFFTEILVMLALQLMHQVLLGLQRPHLQGCSTNPTQIANGVLLLVPTKRKDHGRLEPARLECNQEYK